MHYDSTPNRASVEKIIGKLASCCQMLLPLFLCSRCSRCFSTGIAVRPASCGMGVSQGSGRPLVRDYPINTWSLLHVFRWWDRDGHVLEGVSKGRLVTVSGRMGTGRLAGELGLDTATRLAIMTLNRSDAMRGARDRLPRSVHRTRVTPCDEFGYSVGIV